MKPTATLPKKQVSVKWYADGQDHSTPVDEGVEEIRVRSGAGNAYLLSVAHQDDGSVQLISITETEY